MPPPHSAVVLVFDRLQAGFLGPYGGTWCDTPACNRLASEGYLAEQAWSDSDDLETIYRSFWSGRHAACRSAPAAADEHATPPPGLALAERLNSAGLYTELVTDDPVVASHRWGDAFQERLMLPHDEAPGTAETAGSMRVAQLLAAAAERWDDLRSPSLLWIHASAWNDAWDAPFEFRQQWADEEDPTPPELVVPPSRVLGAKFDPDELLGYVQAYVGQIAAWDACLDAWLEAFKSGPLADEALLVVTSPRGFPLGEHGRVGAAEPALFSELLQTPLFVRHPGARWPLVRDQGLVQPADLYATLLDWFQVAATPPPTWGRSLLARTVGLQDDRRDVAAAVGPGQFALRTPTWMLRTLNATANSDERHELYVKPDDRWEANEVGARCDAAVEEMRALATIVEEVATRGSREDLPVLGSEL